MVVAAAAALLLVTAVLWAPGLWAGPGQAGLLLAVATGAAAFLAGPAGALRVALAGLPAVLAIAAAGALLGERWPDDADRQDVILTGAVCEFPRLQPGSWRFALDLDEASRRQGLPRRVLVSWYDGAGRPARPPAPGETWQLELRLRAPRGLSNPGTFDYERWLFAARIDATGWVRDAAANGRQPGSADACPPAGWRAELARRISAALPDRASAPYVLGLAIGAYQALPEAEWARLRATGTIHLISISGFHIALVAAPAALAGLALGRLWLAAGRRCRPGVVAAWTAVVVASGYGALAGFSVPTARSVLAVIVVALLTSARRVVSGPELLAAVILAVLLVEPLAPLTPGFWLSFAGVIVLVAAAAVVARGARRPGALRMLVVTQLAMTAGLAPLLAIFFGQIPAGGLLTNLVAVPAFSLVLLPLTLLGTAVVAFAPGAGAWLLGLAADGFDAWRLFVAFCADLPGGVWYLPEAAAAGQLLALAGAVLLLWPPPWPVRWLGLALLTGLAAAAESPVPAGGVRVTVLDVGQGLAVLVRTAGHALLYDAGPAFRGSDAGERVVVPVLRALATRHLDVLLVSHADIDHRGGAPAVIEAYPAVAVLGPSGAPAAPGTPCTRGRAWNWDGVRFEVLHPAAGAPARNDNATSCVLRVTARGASLLLTGDIEAPEEEALVAAGLVAPADLVLAAHHGSRSSSSAAFVQATRPAYVVAAAGHRNRWGFPAAEVVARWRATGACVLATAEEGALRFESVAGGGFALLRAERRSAPGLWLDRPPAGPPCR